MKKRILTILTLITLLILVIKATFWSTPRPSIEQTITLKEEWISPSLLKITSSRPLKELRIKAQQPLPDYVITPLSAQEFQIAFEPPSTGWFGTAQLQACTLTLFHRRKIDLALINWTPASFKINSFAPMNSKRWGGAGLTLLITQSGSLNGMSLHVENPQESHHFQYFCDLWVKAGDMWNVLFDEDLETPLINRERKTLSFPLKLSPTAGLIAFIQSPERRVEDLLIYRSQIADTNQGWGQGSLLRRVRRIAKLTGFPYSPNLPIEEVLLTKGVGATRQLIRQKGNVPFTQGNVQNEPRNTRKQSRRPPNSAAMSDNT